MFGVIGAHANGATTMLQHLGPASQSHHNLSCFTSAAPARLEPAARVADSRAHAGASDADARRAAGRSRRQQRECEAATGFRPKHTYTRLQTADLISQLARSRDQPVVSGRERREFPGAQCIFMTQISNARARWQSNHAHLEAVIVAARERRPDATDAQLLRRAWRNRKRTLRRRVLDRELRRAWKAAHPELYAGLQQRAIELTPDDMNAARARWRMWALREARAWESSRDAGEFI